MISATIGQTSLNTLRPSWRNSLSRAPIPPGAARFRKPKLLRMLFEKVVFRRESMMRKGARDKLFRQDGRKVFKEVCPMVAEIIVRQLGDLGIPLAALRRLWLHQANLGMNQLIGRRVLGREPLPEETPVILDTYANTSSAGSIIAFHQFRDDLARGERGVICSFGAGYSVGSLVVERCD